MCPPYDFWPPCCEILATGLRNQERRKGRESSPRNFWPPQEKYVGKICWRMVKLGCVILREIDFLLKICWSIPCLHPSWKVHTWVQCLWLSPFLLVHGRRKGSNPQFSEKKDFFVVLSQKKKFHHFGPSLEKLLITPRAPLEKILPTPVVLCRISLATKVQAVKAQAFSYIFTCHEYCTATTWRENCWITALFRVPGQVFSIKSIFWL